MLVTDSDSRHLDVLQLNRTEIQSLLDVDADVDIALGDRKKTWKIKRTQDLGTPTLYDHVVDASHWSLSSLALLIILLVTLYKCCNRKEKSNSTSTKVMQTHGAGCQARLENLSALEREVDAQKREIQRLWQELNRMKTYQL